MELTDGDLFPGPRFTAYRGMGDLIVDCGSERLSQPCEFVCAQMTDGRLICHCFWSEGDLNPWKLLSYEQQGGAFRLLGCTEDGLPVSAHCLRHSNFTSPVVYEGRSYRNIASFNAEQIHAGSQTVERAHQLTFLLVNLTLESHGAEWTHGELTIRIDRVQEYDLVIRLLRAVGGVGVTAAALVSAPGGTDILEAATVMDDELSVLLSLARDNLIQWIAVEAQEATGRPLALRHRNPVTKPFSPYQFVTDADTVRFVSETLPGLSVLDGRWGFEKAVLSLVDAAITTDFIEARGLKAAVILDFLYGRFREVAGRQTLLPSTLFRRWIKMVEAYIRQLTDERFTGVGLRPALVDQMLKHLPALNHYAFAQSLDDLLLELKLVVDPERVKQVVAIRNKLVHKVEYPSRSRGTQAMVDEYHLLQRFVVQILLALVGYTGHFNDWTRLTTAEGAELGLRVPMRNTG